MRIALEHPVLGGRTEIAPGAVRIDRLQRCKPHKVGLTVLEAFGLPGLDCALREAFARIRYDQTPVNPDDAAKTPAAFAGANRGVEAEMARRDGCKAVVAESTLLFPAPAPICIVLGRAVDNQAPLGLAEAGLDRFAEPTLVDLRGAKAVLHHVDKSAPARFIGLTLGSCVALR
ncbi:MAG: hypothetical protein EBX02_11325 [Betaproteobacteria bacterium]|nr:hypothetical protein [Betaproteobacteria bacterium]